MELTNIFSSTLILICTALMASLHSTYGSPEEREIILKSNGITYMQNIPRRRINMLKLRRTKRSALITEVDKLILLNEHNDKRRMEPSSNMEVMIWNDDLADMAQLWADRCQWKHGQDDAYNGNLPYDTVGQNLYLTTGTLNLASAMRAWSDSEKKYYSYNTGECVTGKQCRHYTQVVWAESREVGCAHAFCAQVSGIADSTNLNYLVCNYGPMGNIGQRKPFQLGLPCSECQSGRMWCDDGLCRNDCSSPSPNCQCSGQCANGGCLQTDCSCRCQDGYHGTSCRGICVDTNQNCGANPGWPRSWCDQGHQYVLDNCPLMCGTCKPYTGNNFGCPTSTQTTNRRTSMRTSTENTPTSTEASPCSTYFCRKGGVALADPSGCSCYCTTAWMGPTCEESRSEARHGVIMHTSAASDQWIPISSALTSLIGIALDNYCQTNPTECCSNKQLSNEDRFTFQDQVFIGASYPNYGSHNGERSSRILFYARAMTLQGQCGNDVPQGALYSALYSLRQSFDNAIRICCDSILFSLEKAIETPHRALPTSRRPVILTTRPSLTMTPRTSTIKSPRKSTVIYTTITSPANKPTSTKLPDVLRVTNKDDEFPIPIWVIAILTVLGAGIIFAIVSCVLCLRYYRRNDDDNHVAADHDKGRF